MSKLSVLKTKGLSDPTNGGAQTIALSEPYTVTVAIAGTADILFNRWNPEAVEVRALEPKNSKGKIPTVEGCVYRNDNDALCIPGVYLRGSIINAAKFRQDPRSPRKSAMDLYKAAIVSLTRLASLGVSAWDYEDKCRALVQRSAINRVRPALRAGWRAEFQIMVMLPEYIGKEDLRSVIEQAGRLVGVGDNRPTYGRFGVVKFE